MAQVQGLLVQWLARRMLPSPLFGVLVSSIIPFFVREICSTLLSSPQAPSRHSSEEHESSLRIQFPLFEQLILGELEKCYLTNDAEGIRWIAQLNQFFISRTSMTSEFLRSINVAFSVPLIDQQFFLRKSLGLEHSPITLELIINDLARTLTFATHHLSEGILLPSDQFHRVRRIVRFCP